MWGCVVCCGFVSKGQVGLDHRVKAKISASDVIERLLQIFKGQVRLDSVGFRGVLCLFACRKASFVLVALDVERQLQAAIEDEIAGVLAAALQPSQLDKQRT